MPIKKISEFDVNVSGFLFNKKSAQAFQDEVNRQVSAINAGIELYNAPKHASRQAETLKLILSSLQALREIQPNTVLKKKFQAFDVVVLEAVCEMEAAGRRLAALSSPKTLTELIEKMPLEEAEQFTAMLMTSDNSTLLKNNLRAFYSPGDVKKKHLMCF